jgi:uncharacterized membrane protein YkoI
MRISRTKRLLLSGAAIVGVAAGAAGIAGAATGGQVPAPTHAAADNREDSSYTSSVTVAEGPESQSEADETASLKSVATVTADQARSAALTAVSGTPGAVELGNENGNVVWNVTVTSNDGTVTDVKVDAGNGTVLARDSDGNEVGEAGKAEANQSNDPAEAPNT